VESAAEPVEAATQQELVLVEHSSWTSWAQVSRRISPHSTDVAVVLNIAEVVLGSAGAGAFHDYKILVGQRQMAVGGLGPEDVSFQGAEML